LTRYLCKSSVVTYTYTIFQFAEQDGIDLNNKKTGNVYTHTRVILMRVHETTAAVEEQYELHISVRVRAWVHGRMRRCVLAREALIIQYATRRYVVI
jgi:hypothetical protein